MIHPFDDPSDIAFRPPLDPVLPFPPNGSVGHPNLKEHLYTNLSEGQTVVDVGCGPGPFDYTKYRARFIAFDMFEPASREGLKTGDEFRLGKLETLPVEDASVDAVTMGFILEHVEKPEVFLREANRALKPGGWCYISVPNHRSIEDRLFRLATTIAGSERGPHIQRFTFDNFGALAAAHTSLELVAWHLLPASFLFMQNRLGALRKPTVALLRLPRILGFDPLAEGNYQFLFRKRLS